MSTKTTASLRTQSLYAPDGVRCIIVGSSMINHVLVNVFGHISISHVSVGFERRPSSTYKKLERLQFLKICKFLYQFLAYSISLLPVHAATAANQFLFILFVLWLQQFVTALWGSSAIGKSSWVFLSANHTYLSRPLDDAKMSVRRKLMQWI